jgi:hypothetical protein
MCPCDFLTSPFGWLLPRLILPKLQQRTRPCRVVTYLYKIPGIAFSSRHVVPVKESSNDVAFPIFVYEFPAAAESDNISSLLA